MSRRYGCLIIAILVFAALSVTAANIVNADPLTNGARLIGAWGFGTLAVLCALGMLITYLKR